MLINLFANAGRHAPESSSIRVAAVRKGAEVAVSVADEGPGGWRRSASRGSSASTRARARTARPAGHGLGLAICKGLIEGARGAASAPRAQGAGRGTTVTFTLPLAGEPGAAAAARAGAGGRGERRGDAHPGGRRRPADACASCAMRLSGAGYAPLVTGEAQELEQVIRAERPRLVLLDLLLPGHDGIELMQEVRERFDLPVIFISAYGRDETVARALESGRGRLPRQALLADRAPWPGSARRSGATNGPSRSCSVRSPSTTPGAG